MDDIILLPQNLSALGVKRQIEEPKPDLLTIWDTTYPVLTNYIKWAERMGFAPFAGGDYREQGPDWEEGYINSGYRTGPGKSAHLFAIAIDPIMPELDRQIEGATKAKGLFTRVGLYPHHKIVHLDLAPIAWMEKFGGRRYWVCEKVITPQKKEARKYTSFDVLNEAIIFAREVL